MKKVLFVLLVFLVTLSSFAAEPAPITSWTRQDSVYPTTPGVLAPQMAGATIYGDYIYVLGGNQGQDGDTHRAVSYTHLRAHETVLDLVCRLLLEKKKTKKKKKKKNSKKKHKKKTKQSVKKIST